MYKYILVQIGKNVNTWMYGGTGRPKSNAVARQYAKHEGPMGRTGQDVALLSGTQAGQDQCFPISIANYVYCTRATGIFTVELRASAAPDTGA